MTWMQRLRRVFDSDISQFNCAPENPDTHPTPIRPQFLVRNAQP